MECWKQTDNPSTKFSDEFLWELLKENLNHARHVENERITFVTLFTALVGGSFAILSTADPISNHYWRVLIIATLLPLLFLNILSLALTRRWNHTYDKHMDRARQIYKQLAHMDKTVKDTDSRLDEFYPLCFNDQRGRIHTTSYFTIFLIFIGVTILAYLFYYILFF